MINKKMIIFLANMNKMKFMKDTIDNCFKDNIYNLKPNSTVETFKDSEIMISEARGWTEVSEIEKVEYCDNWIEIKTEHGKSLTCSPNQLIPIYDLNKKKIGFHGETQYEFKEIEILNVKIGDVVRVRNCQYEYTDIFFDKVVEINIYDAEENDYGFKIETKSKYYNCNDIYISNY